MVEQERYLENGLRGCVKAAGLADAADAWPAIRERVGERSSGEEVAETCHPRRFRLTPRTRVGWVLVSLLVLLVGTTAYAATFGISYDLFREALPGEEGQHLGKEIDRAKTAGGARITLEYAYADEKYVVVGYSVKDLKDRNIDGYPSEIVPAPEIYLSDGGGRHFDVVDGTTSYPITGKRERTPKPNTAVFKAREDLKSGGEHRFHLKVPVEEWGSRFANQGSVPTDPDPGAGPFAFDFEIPVRPVPIVEVNKEVEAKGVTLTLKRVINSPGRPQAIVCFEPPPGDGWGYFPELARGSADEGRTSQELKGNCESLMMDDTVEGHSKVTVSHLTYLEGEVGKEPVYPRRLAGPWTFEFEAPDP